MEIANIVVQWVFIWIDIQDTTMIDLHFEQMESMP